MLKNLLPLICDLTLCKSLPNSDGLTVFKVQYYLAKCFKFVSVKVIIGAFNKQRTLVGTFSEHLQNFRELSLTTLSLNNLIGAV